MFDPMMPAFLANPSAAIIIGRILSSYGELEFELARCTAAALNDEDAAYKALFRMRGEEARIQVADAMMRQKFIAAGLENPYAETISGMSKCRKLRNNYAHCHWIVEGYVLCFVEMEEIVEKNTPLDFTRLTSCPVDDPLLENQEAYFKFVQRRFWYLEAEYRLRAGLISSHVFPMPPLMQAPLEHR